MSRAAGDTPVKNPQHFFSTPEESITIKYGSKKIPLTLYQCKNTVCINSITDEQLMKLGEIQNLNGKRIRMSSDIILILQLPSGIDVERIARQCNIAHDQVNTFVYQRVLQGDDYYVPGGEIYLKFNEGTSKEIIAEIFQQHGLRVAEEIENLTFVVLCNPTKNSLQIGFDLQQNPHVICAEPELRVVTERSPLCNPTAVNAEM